MSNDKCPVGRENRANIKNLQRWVGKLDRQFNRIEMWLIGILGAMALNAILLVSRWILQAAHAK